jgi:hypothetical protein
MNQKGDTAWNGLPLNADGTIDLIARAWAIRGAV